MNTEPLAALYHIPSSDLHKIASGFQNSTFQFTRDGKRYILRVTGADRRDLHQVLGELDWLRWLWQQEMPVAQPIPTINGLLAEEVVLPDQRVIVTAFDYAPGSEVNVQNPDEWNTRFFHRWGELTGKMHAVTKSYTPPDSTIRRPDWSRQDAVVQTIVHHFSQTDDALFAKCTQLLDKIAHLPVTDDTYGLIHNDFHQGNFHVQNGQITVFDFDDSRYSWLAGDIAVPFYHAYWQNTSFNQGKQDFADVFLHHFLDGYAKAHTLAKQTVQQIPLFLKWREVFLLYLFQTRWDHSNLQDWQAYTLQDLRQRILHDIPYAHLDVDRLVP